MIGYVRWDEFLIEFERDLKGTFNYNCEITV